MHVDGASVDLHELYGTMGKKHALHPYRPGETHSFT